MSAAEHSDADHAHGHNYVRIWAILVFLLVISVVGPFVGEFTGIQGITLVTAFGIAVYKAYLVVKNFMHLPDERPFVSYLVVTCLVFMFLFYAGTAPDVMKDEGERWRKPLWQEQEAEYARRLAAGEVHDFYHGGPAQDGAGHHEAAAEGAHHEAAPEGGHAEAAH